jgi:hypothetical protein
VLQKRVYELQKFLKHSQTPQTYRLPTKLGNTWHWFNSLALLLFFLLAQKEK